MEKTNFLLLKVLKNTESAQLYDTRENREHLDSSLVVCVCVCVCVSVCVCVCVTDDDAT